MSVERCSANTDDVGDGLDGVLSAGVHLACDSEFVGGEGLWSSADSSSGSRCGEAGECAVADEVAFEFGDAASSEVGHCRARTSKGWIRRAHDPDDDRTGSLHYGVAGPEECVIRGSKANSSHRQRLLVPSIDCFAIIRSEVDHNTSESFGQATPMTRKGGAVEVGMETLSYRRKSNVVRFPFRRRFRNLRAK